MPIATEIAQITRLRRRSSDLCRNRSSMTSARRTTTGSARAATFVRSPAGSDAEITLPIVRRWQDIRDAAGERRSHQERRDRQRGHWLATDSPRPGGPQGSPLFLPRFEERPVDDRAVLAQAVLKLGHVQLVHVTVAG